MGSGTKRRDSDHVMIVPQEKPASGKGGSTASEPSLVCPDSFLVELAEKITVGVPLRLAKEDGGLSIYFGGKKVGEVEKRRARTIILCLTAGYRYDGVAVKRNGKPYGKFEKKL